MTITGWQAAFMGFWFGLGFSAAVALAWTVWSWGRRIGDDGYRWL